MTVVVGVDGGGTRTRALMLGPEGDPVGRGQGPAGLVRPGAAGSSARAVRVAVETAARDAGVELPVDALWAGLAGVGREALRREAESLLEALGLARRVRVGTDVEAAYRDAFGTGQGVLLVAGTGSVALARSPEGEWIRVGGWGGLVGDEGSGYWMGIRAIRAVLAAHDGRGPGTSLTDEVLAAFQVADPEELVAAVPGDDKAEVASLAPAVARAARDGDPVAEGVVREAVDVLRAHLTAVRDRLGAGGALPLALSGGLLGPDRPLRRRLEERLDRADFALDDGEVRPERGAAALARELDAS